MVEGSLLDGSETRDDVQLRRRFNGLSHGAELAEHIGTLDDVNECGRCRLRSGNMEVVAADPQLAEEQDHLDRTFAAYDRVVTAPLHGFADEVDYWRRASCGPYLTKIRRPALLLSAVDDPFVPATALPDPDVLPPRVTLEVTERGGHVGFVEGPPWRVTSWAERRAFEYLRGALDGSLC